MHSVFDIVFDVSSFPRLQYLELSSAFQKSGSGAAYYSLLYVDKGSVILSTAEKEYSVNAKQFFINSPGQKVFLRVHNSQAANLFLVSFILHSGDLLRYCNNVFPITPELQAQVKLILKEGKFSYLNDLRDCTYKSLESAPNRPFGSEQMMKILMEHFLISMVREFDHSVSGKYQELDLEHRLMLNVGDGDSYFHTLLRYLEENIYRSLTLEQIAKENFSSRSKVQRAFQKCAGEGAVSFHQRLKIERAKFMIRETSMNFTQIAEKLGFSSVHHFSKKFKQLVRMSPTEYASMVR